MIRARRRARPARIAMKVLLLGATGAEPSFQSWQQTLNQVGLPFEAVALRGAGAGAELLDPEGNRVELKGPPVA